MYRFGLLAFPGHRVSPFFFLLRLVKMSAAHLSLIENKCAVEKERGEDNFLPHLRSQSCAAATAAAARNMLQRSSLCRVVIALGEARMRLDPL